MKLFKRKPKHEHDPECLRVVHYNISRTDNVFIHDIGPHSRVMWRCKTCRSTWSENYAGTWRPEDFK